MTVKLKSNLYVGPVNIFLISDTYTLSPEQKLGIAASD